MVDAVRVVAVVGTVGVPARYGGFETLAEQLAVGISPDRMALVIYCQRSAYPEPEIPNLFAGHTRVMLPLRANGASSMVYDSLAMFHAAFVARVDTMLLLGYSGAWVLPIVRMLRPGLLVVTNIDGMEWRRKKFGAIARAALRILEWFACRFSNHVIADNAELVVTAREMHGIESTLIAYGGDHTVVSAAENNVIPGYFLSIARIEPENNCHVILQACAASSARLVFVGNWDASAYGRSLKANYHGAKNLMLLDPIYDQSTLAAIRAGSVGYIHGHSVGGSNPSLIEALFHTGRMLAYDCRFNRSTLTNAGDYFESSLQLTALLDQAESGKIQTVMLASLRLKYQWVNIVESYVKLL